MNEIKIKTIRIRFYLLNNMIRLIIFLLRNLTTPVYIRDNFIFLLQLICKKFGKFSLTKRK